MWRPSSLTSLGGMPFNLPPKNMFRNSVCRMSSRWCPSAILVAPSSSATRYRMPRRSREHRLHIVLPSGILSLTMEYVSCSSMWNGTPSASRYAGSTCRREPGLLLVEVDGHQLEAHRRALLHLQQDVQQAVAVLAAGQADHHAVAFLDHVVLRDGLADLAAQALFELVRLALDLRVGRQGLGVGVDPDGGHGGPIVSSGCSATPAPRHLWS